MLQLLGIRPQAPTWVWPLDSTGGFHPQTATLDPPPYTATSKISSNPALPVTVNNDDW